LANDLVRRFDRLLEALVFLLEVEIGERIPEHHQDSVGIERLFEDLVGAELRRFDGGANRGMPADHHYDRGWIELANFLERLHSVHACHLHIEEDEMGTPLLVFLYSISGVVDGSDFVSLELQQLSQRSANSLLIVDDQDSSTHRTLL